ncbi:hypothetical protein BUALT_Bualt17G0039700 [Buddleja alternifolia]|uniref:Uncharacterized protein n=1 Tax=Buddleja alternifolia TaxID=168488 RepID=A0AAV6WGG4_9LAMI|nr:hypothetical protein BUALT_Bualt17G0039700 [Buddleja alternifolia]
MSPENLMIPLDYHHYHYHSLIPTVVDPRINNPVFGSEEELGFQCSAGDNYNEDDIEQQAYSSDVMKAKIASHPSYPRLLDAYIDCQKETYCDILVKYKSDLSRPFDEATSFLDTIQTQLANLCNGASTLPPTRTLKLSLFAYLDAFFSYTSSLAIILLDDGGLSSDDEELSGGEIEIQDTQMKSEDRELKDKLLRRYGGHISSLKLEFSKKKKKGKLPKEARQTLLEWWNQHYKWPYPTEGDKISLAETTGLDQKQINNWFINQRKRHWKSSENMQLAMMDNRSAAHHFFTED